MTKIVTHNAKFHTDDVFAAAALLLVYPEAQINRTREKEVIDSADIVFDVGEEYNAEHNRFDHHQLGGAGNRENGIPYSSFGLVWKKFGEEISGSREVMKRIDSTLVQAIDAGDNGVDTFTLIMPDVFPYLVQGVVNQYRLTWKESSGDWDGRFLECVKWAKSFLERVVKVTQDVVGGEIVVKAAYENTEDRCLVVIDEKYDLGRELVSKVLASMPEPVYTILYRHDHKNWQIVAIVKNSGTFELRKALPESWRARHDEDLDKVTGVTGGIFCHRNGFMCITKTKESALDLAQIALNA